MSVKNLNKDFKRKIKAIFRNIRKIPG